MWSVGAYGNEPILNVIARLHFAHSKKNFSVILKRAYLKGTTEVVGLTREIIVDGPYGQAEAINLFLRPIKAKAGKNLIGKIVFIDQFNRKHLTDKLTFRPAQTPVSLRGNQSINCYFCHKPVDTVDIPLESSVPAHKSCIWK
jgi:hypothetical protein